MKFKNNLTSQVSVNMMLDFMKIHIQRHPLLILANNPIWMGRIKIPLIIQSNLKAKTLSIINNTII